MCFNFRKHKFSAITAGIRQKWMDAISTAAHLPPPSTATTEEITATQSTEVTPQPTQPPSSYYSPPLVSTRRLSELSLGTLAALSKASSSSSSSTSSAAASTTATTTLNNQSSAPIIKEMSVAEKKATDDIKPNNSEKKENQNKSAGLPVSSRESSAPSTPKSKTKTMTRQDSQIQSLHNNILLANEELDKCKEKLQSEQSANEQLRKQLENSEKMLTEANIEKR